MKKGYYFIIIIGLVIISIIGFWLSNNVNDTNLKKITVGEVTHSAFYAPLYVSLEKGFFEDEGLEVELILTSGADKVSAAVLSGDVEIGFAGAESAIYVYKRGEKDYLQIFSGLTKRDGQFILSREKQNDFSLSDLIGKEILVGRETGMPALNFLNALKNEGIDPNLININHSVDFAALSGTFIGGTGDYVNLFEPTALKLENENYGYVVESIGMLSGEMPYTTFYARKSYIEKNESTIKAFVRAINKGLEFVSENNSDVIAKTINKQFADLSHEELTLIIKRYKESDSWLQTNYIAEELLENLEDLMIDNNLLDDYVPYNDLIINYEFN